MATPRPAVPAAQGRGRGLRRLLRLGWSACSPAGCPQPPLRGAGAAVRRGPALRADPGHARHRGRGPRCRHGRGLQLARPYAVATGAERHAPATRGRPPAPSVRHARRHQRTHAGPQQPPYSSTPAAPAAAWPAYGGLRLPPRRRVGCRLRVASPLGCRHPRGPAPGRWRARVAADQVARHAGHQVASQPCTPRPRAAAARAASPCWHGRWVVAAVLGGGLGCQAPAPGPGCRWLAQYSCYYPRHVRSHPCVEPATPASAAGPPALAAGPGGWLWLYRGGCPAWQAVGLGPGWPGPGHQVPGPQLCLRRPRAAGAGVAGVAGHSQPAAPCSTVAAHGPAATAGGRAAEAGSGHCTARAPCQLPTTPPVARGLATGASAQAYGLGTPRPGGTGRLRPPPAREPWPARPP